MVSVKTEVLDSLRNAQIDGAQLVLPNWLDRREYKAVDQVLRNLGGEWNRRAKAHVFGSDPTYVVRQVIETGQAPGPARADEGFVRTPIDLADEMVFQHSDITDLDDCVVLEPSAGDGALVHAIQQANPAATVVCVEPNEKRAANIERRNAPVYLGRLEEYLHEDSDRWPQQFDQIVTNPPFSLPSRPTAWIEHTWHAWRLLKPGGRLVSLAPAGLAFREDRKHRDIRQLIENAGGGWVELDAGTFPDTDVRAVLFWVDKPADFDPEPPKKKRGKPTEAEKQERREEDREQNEAVSAALEDPEFAQQLADRVNQLPIDCRLRSYSARNQALVFAQADALGVQVTGHVNTFKGWAEQGRMVAKGSTALRIVAAMGDEAEQVDEQQESEQQSRKRFRHTTRFDLSQTKSIDEED